MSIWQKTKSHPLTILQLERFKNAEMSLEKKGDRFVRYGTDGSVQILSVQEATGIVENILNKGGL